LGQIGLVGNKRTPALTRSNWSYPYRLGQIGLVGNPAFTVTSLLEPAPTDWVKSD
jgi:hypothetical protein